jgi:hypothetical protein
VEYAVVVRSKASHINAAGGGRHDVVV